MAVSSEKLREKVENMPNVRMNLKNITGKDGRTWVVIETVISKIYSPKYIENVLKGDSKESQNNSVKSTDKPLF